MKTEVIALAGWPPEVLAYAYAMYSRSSILRILHLLQAGYCFLILTVCQITSEEVVGLLRCLGTFDFSFKPAGPPCFNCFSHSLKGFLVKPKWRADRLIFSP